jgi:hypothetical protein
LLATVALVALVAPPSRLQAQPDAGVTVRQPSGGDPTLIGPMVTTIGVLRDQDLRQNIQHGFAARLDYTVELWAQRQWNDPLIADTTWTVIVEYSPLTKQYMVLSDTGGRRVAGGPYATLEEVEALLARPVEAPIRAPNIGRRMYYTATLDIQPISWNELDALQAWLRGDVQPAARGQTNPVTPFVGFIRRTFLRVLGGGRTRYRGSSATFVPGE